ncbi:transient receptor potential cation channel subfamily M member 8-like isoform X2 [Ostrea edulis]|uniref:transient receptor potential cation channel subfamily M member 8-like isoform X2 n=1 Tax=Ostrea edulis TaxID=37623 RepID=UPI0024AFC72F|nr:transient receptor potential cation channel subfamily M member 8-like isoform X2 [Ostrea edulis]
MDQTQRRKKSVPLFMKKFYDGQTRPNMIFSVIGDSENFIPKPWSKSRFQEALIYAAKATGGSWILTNGEPLKVSKTIHEMMEEYVYLAASNKKSAIRLISIPSRAVEDTSLYFDLPEAFEEDNSSSKSKDDEVFMTFFEGKELSDVDYIEHRFAIEKTLEKPKPGEKNALVIILVEGELSAVEHVKLATKNGTPVVVVKGTGGAADLLATYLDLVKKQKKIRLTTLIPTLFGIKLDEGEMTDLSQSLKFIGKRHDLVNVFDLHEKNEEQFAATVGEVVHIAWSLEDTDHWEDDDDDAGALGHTLKPDMNTSIRIRKSTYMKPENWKQLTESWNMADAHEALSSTTFSSPLSLPLDLFFRYSKFLKQRKYYPSTEDEPNEAQELLMVALSANRTDYVGVLLDLNVNLSIEQINKLYKSQFQITEKGSQKESYTGMHWVLKEAIGRKRSTDLCDGENSHDHALKICRKVLKYHKTEDPRLSANCRTNRRKEYLRRQIFLQAILLWCLVANRTHIATLVWRRVANQLYTGLVSALVLKKMSSIARVQDRKTAENLENHSKMFIKRVLNMMDALYETDRKVSFKVLNSLETVWEIQARPISFAHEFQMYDIIAHPCSVGLMEKQWYNGLTPNCKRYISKDLWKHPCTAMNAPCFHFVLHYIVFGVAILLYSYFLLTNVMYFRNMSFFPRLCEVFLYLWTVLDFLHDVKNVLIVHLLQFCSMTIFFVLGVGTFYHAILHQRCPDLFSGSFYHWHIWFIFYYPYYQFFGETFEEKMGIDVGNAEIDWSVKTAIAIYMLVANVLIVNVSIAIFTTKYEEVAKEAELMWQYERYHIVEDFKNRMFAHLDFVFFPILMVYKCIQKCKKEANVKERFRKIRHRQILEYIMAGRSLKSV